MKKAFSMIEIIFVIAVIGILSAIAIPKMFANKKDAEITVLKEQLRSIRTGLEAYAGEQLLIEGVKKYPSRLCSAGCAGAPVYADEVAKGIHRRAANSIGWDNWGDDLLYVTDPKNKKAIFFNYNQNLGTFTCDTSKVRSDWKAEDCSIIGE